MGMQPHVVFGRFIFRAEHSGSSVYATDIDKRLLLDSVCDRPLHGQPHVVCGRFISTYEGWTLLYKELIMAEDNPNITMKRITAV